MEPIHATTDPARCPLCGGPNCCAVACAGAGAGAVAGAPAPLACWCVGARFSADLLARVPPEARGRACICAACTAATPELGQ